MQYIDKHMYKPVHRVRNIVEADNLDIMGLHLNTLLYIEYLPGHIDKAHTHDFWHLFYVTKGEGVIAINDIEEEVCSGHIAIVHPFHEHYFRNISGGITSVVEIKWEYSDQVIEVFSPPACSGFFRDRYGLRQYINRIIEEIVHQPIGWKLILKAIVFELLVQTNRALLKELRSIGSESSLGKTYSYRPVLMKEVENYVHSKLDQPLSVEEISTRFHISPKYLSNIFKAEKGESLASWIIDRKINKAWHLLVTQEDNSITEIARQVGYHDPRYFSRLFRKKTGLTPTDYRSRHLPLV